ncbi:BA14K family protein [Rhizobium wuzhouense]|nr:BA14K family protein [Rhizobium wuzhouense]
MKSVASLLAGTALAVTVMLGGVVMASALLVPQEEEPHFTGLDVKDLWTLTPVRIDTQAQTYERLPPRYGSQVVMASVEEKQEADVQLTATSVAADLDIIKTSALADSGDMNRLPEQHVDWCKERYRSYSADDNSYMSYGGDMRTCISPHLEGPTTGQLQGENAILVQDVADGTTSVAISSAHAQNCLQRYRSYRAQDNSYQPYGGGPRKQCELRSF